ncbi:mRNA-capping enzyme subunit beta [Microbotryomycetes sp. JL201]|nr:mRNA-capping enzyme subunit beta [Microbotryomycetes sp. JL201]
MSEPSPSPGAAVRPSPSRSPSISALLNPSPAPDSRERDAVDIKSTSIDAHDYFRGPVETTGAFGERHRSKRQRTASPPPPSSSIITSGKGIDAEKDAASAGEGSMLPPKMSRRDSQPRPSSSSGSTTRPQSSHLPVAQHSPSPSPSPSATAHALHPPSAPPGHKLQPLEPSIFNIAPIDEFTKEVADWLWGFVKTTPWRDPANPVEIEAKIGTLIMANEKPGLSRRIDFPVAIETILVDDSWTRFDSSMNKFQFQHFQQLLNQVVNESLDPSHTNAKLHYHHFREVDTFYESKTPHPSGQTKVRVTRDPNGKVINVIRKLRVADLAVYSPKRMFDWRLSVNVEAHDPEVPTSTPTIVREKDRRSYTHQVCRVDLTQVETKNRRTPEAFELEVEFRDARKLFEEAYKEELGEPNVYLDMVQTFLNSIRMLIRNAGP